jgi:CheY-like chemotaxis protein
VSGILHAIHGPRKNCHFPTVAASSHVRSNILCGAGWQNGEDVPISNYHILLIDDSQAEAKLFESALQEVAPRVTMYWVASAKEGLEYLRQEGRFQGTGSASIVVCDLNMPGRSGFDFAAEMKTDRVLMPIPLIVYSGSQAPHDISRAYSLGANSYLVKPMTMGTMVRQVELLVKYWLDSNKLVNA